MVLYVPVYQHRSADLSDSDVNEQLERSLKKVTRVISVPENEKLEEENKFLLVRYMAQYIHERHMHIMYVHALYMHYVVSTMYSICRNACIVCIACVHLHYCIYKK